MSDPTLAEIWHKLGKIEERVESFSDRLAPLETFSKAYAADRNRILGAVAAITLTATLLIGGVKQWVINLIGGQ